MTIPYIAGFFDGECCITISGNKIRIAATQTNEEVLNQIKNYLGFGTVLQLTKRKSHWKDAWGYYITNNQDCLTTLELLLPHLIVKKEKALLAISNIKNRAIEVQNKKEGILKAVKMIDEGLSYREIEKITGINRQTICNNKNIVRGAA